MTQAIIQPYIFRNSKESYSGRTYNVSIDSDVYNIKIYILHFIILELKVEECHQCFSLMFILQFLFSSVWWQCNPIWHSLLRGVSLCSPYFNVLGRVFPLEWYSRHILSVAFQLMTKDQKTIGNSTFYCDTVGK